MPVPDEYAARTVCRDHVRVCTKELRGSLRHHFYSDCEGKYNYRCKFSHTIFNTARVLSLSTDTDFAVTLDYGHGFERYGSYEGWDTGWDVNVNGRELHSGGSTAKTWHLPAALLLAEHKLGIATKGSPAPQYSKVQTLCVSHYQNLGCPRVNCRYDHNLIDSKRIERLAETSWANSGTDRYDFLSVECRVRDGRASWKITLKPDVFTKLQQSDPMARTIPPRPFSYEDEDLLNVVRHMEGIIGITVRPPDR